MANEQNTQETLTHIRSALAKRDGEELARAISILVALSPDRWREVLARAAVWPHPNGASRHRRLAAAILDARRALRRHPILGVLELLDTWLDFNARYRAFEADLKRLAFWASPPETQIWRLCAFVESQFALVNLRARVELDKQEQHDPSVVLTAAVAPLQGGARVSLQDVVELHGDALDLILRLLLRESPPTGTLDNLHALSPYGDPDFARVLMYAHYWNVLDYLWECVIYQNWSSHRGSSEVVLSAPDETTLVRRAVMAQRELLFPLELEGHVFGANHAALRVMQNAATELARQIKVQKGAVWDCGVDAALIRTLLYGTPEELLVETYIEERHFGILLANIVIKSRDLTINWNDWKTARSFIMALGRAIALAALRDGVDASKATDCLDAVVLTRLSSLAATLAVASVLEHSRTIAMLAALVFDPARRELDIYHQPLVPVGDDLVFIVPALTSSYNPARAVECLARQYVAQAVMARGVWFEDRLAEAIELAIGCPVAKRFKFRDDVGDEIEVDLLFTWAAELFVVETKCLHAVDSPHDEFRAEHAISEAVEQLVLRERKLRESWDQLQTRLPNGFPARCPERITLVCLTNLLRFSGSHHGDVLVTDDLAFRRYFARNTLELLSWSGHEGSNVIAEKELFSGARSPEGFRTYLRELPQFKSLVEGGKLTWSSLPALTNELLAIRYPAVEMTATATSPFMRVLDEPDAPGPG